MRLGLGLGFGFVFGLGFGFGFGLGFWLGFGLWFGCGLDLGLGLGLLLNVGIGAVALARDLFGYWFWLCVVKAQQVNHVNACSSMSHGLGLCFDLPWAILFAC